MPERQQLAFTLDLVKQMPSTIAKIAHVPKMQYITLTAAPLNSFDLLVRRLHAIHAYGQSTRSKK